MFMVTIQSKIILNNRVVKISKNKRICLIYLVFCIASKQVVKAPEDKRFHLTYLLAYTINKQVVKVPRFAWSI